MRRLYVEVTSFLLAMLYNIRAHYRHNQFTCDSGTLIVDEDTRTDIIIIVC